MGNCRSISPSLINPQQIKLCKKTFIIKDQEILTEWIYNIKSLNKNIPIDYLLIPHITQLQIQHQLLCGSQQTVELWYDTCLDTLNDRIERCDKSNRKMPEGQLWYLLYALLKVGKYFNKINKPLGNITINNIHYDSQGQIKIHTTLSTLDSYYHMKVNKIKTHSQQYDIFSIGIIVLSAATLTDLTFIIDNQHTIDIHTHRILLQAFHKLQKGYSQKINQVLRDIIVNKDQNIKYTLIWQIVQNLQSKILTRQFAGHQLRNSDISNPKLSTIYNSATFFRTSQVNLLEPISPTKQVVDRYKAHYNYNI